MTTHFAREDTETATSTRKDARRRKLKPQFDITKHLLEWLKLKIVTSANAGWNSEKLDDRKMVRPPWQIFWQFPQKLNVHEH